MRKESALVFDDRDEEAAALLIGLGLPRNLAKALVFLAQVEEAVSADIEQGANLRQPEVSLAMQDLRGRGWAVKRDLKREGKGRPVHAYRLVVPLGAIVSAIEAEKRLGAEQHLTALARLRQIAGTTR